MKPTNASFGGRRGYSDGLGRTRPSVRALPDRV